MTKVPLFYVGRHRPNREQLVQEHLVSQLLLTGDWVISKENTNDSEDDILNDKKDNIIPNIKNKKSKKNDDNN